MSSRANHIRILAVLLAMAFLGAQFHFCADIGARPTGSHLCPICWQTGAAISAHTPGISLGPVVLRLEATPIVLAISSAVPRAIAPRAPPAI